MAWWLECSPIVWETWVQYQVKSCQRFKKWYLIPPCLTLSIIRYGSRVNWSNPGRGVAPFPIPLCSSYRKGSLWVTLNYGCQLYFLLYFMLKWVFLISNYIVWFVWVLWHINLCRLFNVQSVFIQINSSISNNSVVWLVVLFYGVSTLFRSFNTELNFKQFSLASVCSLNVKTVLFQEIQFSISSHLVLFDP